jgi:protein-disulfide isomerase
VIEMKLADFASKTLISVSVLCAVTVTALLIRREFFAAPSVRQPTRKAAAPTPVDDWARYAMSGHRMGPVDAPITIVEFADFECPACGHFTNVTLKQVEANHPGQVAVVFHHWPLTYHRFAYPMARASECAAEQGRFKEFHDLVFTKQDSLGLKSMEAFARGSSVADVPRFLECAAADGKLSVIEEDVGAAKFLGGQGTPFVLVNGLAYSSMPDSAALETVIRSGRRQAP